MDDTNTTGTATFVVNTADLLLGKTDIGSNPFKGDIALPRKLSYGMSIPAILKIFTAERWWFGV